MIEGVRKTKHLFALFWNCLPAYWENLRKRFQLKVPFTHSLHEVVKTVTNTVKVNREESLVSMFVHIISYQIQSAFCCLCLHSIQSTSISVDSPPTAKLHSSFSPDSLWVFLVHRLVTHTTIKQAAWIGNGFFTGGQVYTMGRGRVWAEVSKAR